MHLKSWLPRTCEALIVDQMKEKILENSTKFQIGGQPGHTHNEHVFTIISIIVKAEKDGEGIIFTAADIIKFFDKEDIYDVMGELYNSEVDPKLCRLWYKMNEETVIKVKTANGISKEGRAGPCVGQGSGGGALNSQLSLDRGIEDYFRGSADEYYYGNVRCQGVIYQDDTGRSSITVSQAQSGNTKLNAVFKDKGVKAHPDKSSYIVCGSKKYKDKVMAELKITPLKFGDFNMKHEKVIKYLGMKLHEDGIAASVQATVEERSGKIRGATFEIKNIIEDFRMAALGGLMGAWVLWERALVPSLLAGCCNWVNISQKTVDQLDNLQNLYIRVQMRTPQSCTKVMLRAEVSMLAMKQRLWMEKVKFIQRLKRMENSLAKEVYQEQRQHDWPGLAKEVTEICKELGIEDVNEKEVSKETVEEEIFYHHYKELKKEMDSKEKCKDIKHEDFREVQSYMKTNSIENARMKFSLRAKMYNCRANMHGKYDEDNRGCPACTMARGREEGREGDRAE